jgi:hypothetical protein
MGVALTSVYRKGPPEAERFPVADVSGGRASVELHYVFRQRNWL